MKYFILSIYCLTFLGNACVQSNVVNFSSAMTFVPVDQKVDVTNITYQEGKFSTIKRGIIKGEELKQHARSINDLIRQIEHLIDDIQLINYKEDTLYVLSEYYLPNASVSMTIKTQKGAFDIVYSIDGEYSIRPIEDSYIDIPKSMIESDYLLYKSIFTWDIDLLIKLIKSSGGLLGGEYSMSATRIILKDYQVFKKEIINFEPALSWHF